MKKWSIWMLIVLMMPTVVFAYDVKINGLYYNLIKKGNVAEVVKGVEFNSSGAAYDLYYEGDIVIPETIEVDGVIYVVERIGEKAFSSCVNVTSILLNEKIKHIGDFAFSGLNIKKIELPSSLQSIGDKSFSYSGISELYIPASVNSIGKGIICHCDELEKVVVDSNNEKYDSRDNCNCIIETSTNYLLDGCKKSIIPNTVTKIEDNAFDHCEKLESIVIPSSVISIGEYCFENCNNLNNLIFNEGLISVGMYEFSGNSLEEVCFPNSLRLISDYSWYQCNKLKKITFGKNLNSLGIAFIYCKAIEEVYCLNTYPPSLNNSTFNGSDVEYATLYVPAESVDSYKNSAWRVFGKILPLPKEEMEKCATPTISYKNGKLTFACSTEGVECVTNIRNTDIKTHYGNEITLSATYDISVYATKFGYDNSETATATLCWIDAEPKMEGITDGVAQITSKAVLIQSEGGILKVEGVDDGTSVSVYTPDGKEVGSAVSRNGAAFFCSKIKLGTVAILKIGEKAIKVIIK